MNKVEKARKAERERVKKKYESNDVAGVSAAIVVQSHLSDAQLESSVITEGNEQNELRQQANKRLNFVKFIINRLHGDLTYNINPNTLWKEFLESNS